MTHEVPDPASAHSDIAADPICADILRALGHTGRLIRETIAIPETDRAIDVIRPADIETLLDQAADDPEQNLPYWAEIWPSGIALAAKILRHPDRVAHLPVIELGSGVGITAAAAIECGAQLTATDYSSDSLLITRLTCRMFTDREPDIRQINWRSGTADLLQRDGSRWPIVLAADVLYEQRDIEPVLDTLQRILAPSGVIFLAEPRRRPSLLAIDRARERGWEIATVTYEGPWPDPKDAGTIVNVHTIRISHPEND